MHKTLHILAFAATLGATSLFASDVSSGSFLLTGTPDDVKSKIVHAAGIDFSVNEYGYVKQGADHHVVGWSTQEGVTFDPANWDSSLNALSSVRLKDSTAPATTTTFVKAQFFFPLADAIDATHSYQWNVFDWHGGAHGLTGTFTKIPTSLYAATYALSFAEDVKLNGSGGPLIDGGNPLVLNFDAAGLLRNVSDATSPMVLFIGEEPDYSDEVVFTLDLGITSGLQTQLTADDAFSVDHTEQDGSGASKAVSAYVDGNADFHTVYADGSEAVTFQLAHITVGTNPGESVVRAPLTELEQAAINTALGN